MECINNTILSIIIPCYNVKEQFWNLLNRLIDQCSSNVEIIIIDDGSYVPLQYLLPDSSNIVYIYQENKGVSSARNRGIDIAKGTYITFIDSDDEISLNYIHEIFAMVSNNCDLHQFGSFNKNNEEQVKNESLYYSGKINEFINTRYFYEHLFLNTIWNKIYKSSIITSNNIRFNPYISLGEDFRFNVEYFRYIENINIYCKYLYIYNTESNDSLSKRHFENFIEDEIDNISNLSCLVNIKAHKNEQWTFYIENKYIYLISYYFKNYNHKSLSKYELQKIQTKFLCFMQNSGVKYDLQDALFVELLLKKGYLMNLLIIKNYQLLSKLYLKLKGFKK